MAERKDGGPVFPSTHTVDYGENKYGERQVHTYTKEGISLRDWFAGQVIAGSLDTRTDQHDRLAAAAYQLADAMLKARGSDT